MDVQDHWLVPYIAKAQVETFGVCTMVGRTPLGTWSVSRSPSSADPKVYRSSAWNPSLSEGGGNVIKLGGSLCFLFDVNCPFDSPADGSIA